MKKWMMTGVLTAVAVATMACTTVSNAAQEDSTAQAKSGDTKKEKTAESSAGQEVEGILPNDLEWEENPDIEGVASTTAIGDPTSKGLYVAFGRMDQDAAFPPHSHPDDRLTTVISGTMYYGVGEEFDEDNMTAYPAGSVIFTPAGTPHIMWVPEGQAVIQESGDGPSGAEFVEEPAE